MHVAVALAVALASPPPVDIARWERAAASGDQEAAYNLGQAYRLGVGVEAQPRRANIYYLRSALAGFAPAQERLGLSLYEAPQMRAESLYWLEKAAAAGQPTAQYVMGISHLNGDGVPRDKEKGRALLAAAARNGVAPARTALAKLAAAPPSAAPARSGAHAVQIGAYATSGAAAKALAAARKHLELGAYKPNLEIAGPVTRVRFAGIPSAAAAAALCARLKAKGIACLPVKH